MATKAKENKRKVDKEQEVPSFQELNQITVIGDLSDYARAYLELANPTEEESPLLLVVDGSKPINNKQYLEIGQTIATQETKPYVLVTAESIDINVTCLLTYLRERGVKATYNLMELKQWLSH